MVQALAKRSEYEAKPEKQGMFKEILHNENNSAAEYVNQLAGEFEGMKVLDMNTYHSTGSVGVIVGKSTKNDSGTGQNQIHRTLTMRHEKDGWKVQDYGKAIEFQPSRGMPARGSSRGKKR